MAAESATPVGYFLMDNGIPVRRLSEDRWPEILRNGEWEPYRDLWKFTHEADPVSKEEFNAAVKAASEEE